MSEDWQRISFYFRINTLKKSIVQTTEVLNTWLFWESESWIRNFFVLTVIKLMNLYNFNLHISCCIFLGRYVTPSDMLFFHSLILRRCCWQKNEAASVCLQWRSLKRTFSSRTRTRRVLWWRGGFWRWPAVLTSSHRSIAPSRQRCVGLCEPY